MGLIALQQITETVCRMGEALSGADKEYVAQFSFRTGDGELTNKLIDELTAPEADKKAVYQRFNTMMDFQPEWIRSIENLLVSLEIYRAQEEKALKTLTEIFSAYGIELSQKEIQALSPEKIKDYVGRLEAMQR